MNQMPAVSGATTPSLIMLGKKNGMLGGESHNKKRVKKGTSFLHWSPQIEYLLDTVVGLET